MFADVASITPLVQPDDIALARELLTDVISTTPVLYSRVLSEQAGGPVYLKCENLQRTGSFKVRGAYTRIARLSDAERARGVVAASAGNHAQGVAFAAGLLGASAIVVMPERAPIPKVEATRAYGAEVILHGRSVEDALDEALLIAAKTGAVFIHPFDHPDIVAGQGTLGFEIIEQCPQVRTILVPAGGGGIAAGVTIAVHSLDPEVKVVCVQSAAVPGLVDSLAAGHPVQVVGAPTMADGIAVQRPGDIPFAILPCRITSAP
jgi:threonine dehydratase